MRRVFVSIVSLAMLLTLNIAVAQQESESGEQQASEETKKPSSSCSSISFPNPNYTERKPKITGLSERTYKSLERLQVMIGENQARQALPELQDLLKRVEGANYEEAVVEQTIGFAHASLEQYDQALQHWNRAIQLDAMPNNAHFSMMLQSAQLEMGRDNFRKTLQILDEWFANADEIKLMGYELQAQALTSLNEFRPAITAIKQAISRCEKPKETWYQLLMALHVELKEFREAADVLKILVTEYPYKRKYWTQLAAMYMSLQLDKQALSTLALAHLNGLFEKETDYIQLYQLYSFLEVPYKAGEVLQEGLENGIVESTKQRWQDLANAWYAARELERSLQAYERAGELALDGKVDLSRAYILVDLERFDEAKEALQAAVEKGGLNDSDTGNAWVLLGMSRYETCDTSNASEAFRQARQFERSRSSAGQWLNHIETQGPKKGCTT